MTTANSVVLRQSVPVLATGTKVETGLGRPRRLATPFTTITLHVRRAGSPVMRQVRSEITALRATGRSRAVSGSRETPQNAASLAGPFVALGVADHYGGMRVAAIARDGASDAAARGMERRPHRTVAGQTAATGSPVVAGAITDRED